MELPFHSKPEEFHNSNPKWNPEELHFWDHNLLPKLLQEGAIQEISEPTRYVSSSRLEPKRSGGFRHIVDLRNLNKFLLVPKCKYETLA